MPSLDDLYMRSQDRARPYGPSNPPPPPAGSPPMGKLRKEIKFIKRESTHADEPREERGHDLYRRREHLDDSPQRYSPDHGREEERRGRPRSSSSRRNDGRAGNRWYRVGTPKRSESTTPGREVRRSPSRRSEVSRVVRRSRSPSPRRSAGGRYRSRSRSRSPRRDARDYHHQYQYHEEKEEYEGTKKSSWTRHGGPRSLTPVAERERRILDTSIPATAYPLRDYTNYISDHHANKRRITYENRGLPTFKNGDGKVNPSAYGSVLQYDFGLCYCTFRTLYACEMGIRCPWRHHPLSAREKDWIEEIAREKGKRFVEEAERCWASPDVPVPGNNMIEVMQREQDRRRRS